MDHILEGNQDALGYLSAHDAHHAPTGLAATQSAAAPRRARISTGFTRHITPGASLGSSSEKRLALLALLIACASVFITSMDMTVVVTALPQIIADPGINLSITQLDHASWIVSAYLLGFVIVMPLMGRVSDMYGRRRILLLCLSIFGAGSVLCALAPILSQTVDISFLSHFSIDTSSQGLVWLIAARLIQAIGGGAVVPVAIAVVNDFYGKERLGLALGIIGAVTEAGGVVGPLYGALIVSTLGWTYIFYLNIPMVLLLMFGAWFFTPHQRHVHEGIDWLGTFLLGVALTCLSLGLAQQGTDMGPAVVGSASPQNNPLLLIMAVFFLVLFILLENVKSWKLPHISLRQKPHYALIRQTRWPVVDLGLFKRLPFSATSLVSLVLGAGLIIAMADIPLFVDTVLGLKSSATELALMSGLALLRMTVMIPIGAILGGWLCERLSCRVIGVSGLLLTALGFYLMSQWPANVDWTQITIGTMTTGLGFGLIVSPISTTAIRAVRTTQAGMSAAIVTALRMVGMILALAALTSWGLAYFKHLASEYASLPLHASVVQITQWTQGYARHLINAARSVYSSIFFVTMILCLAGVVPAFFLWGEKATLGGASGLDQKETSEITGLQALAAAQLIADGLTPDEATAVQTLTAAQLITLLVPEINDAQALAVIHAIKESASQVANLPVPQQVVDPDVSQAATVPIPVMLDATDGVEETQFVEPPAAQVAAIALPVVLTANDEEAQISPVPPPDLHRPRLRRRRPRRLLISLALLMLLLITTVLAAVFFWPDSPGSSSPFGVASANSATATPISGPRLIEVALNNVALTALFTSQLNLKGGAVSNLQATPQANNVLVISLDLVFNASGIHRVLPVELDTTVGTDSQQNLQLTIIRLKRDGIDAKSLEPVDCLDGHADVARRVENRPASLGLYQYRPRVCEWYSNAGPAHQSATH